MVEERHTLWSKPIDDHLSFSYLFFFTSSSLSSSSSSAFFCIKTAKTVLQKPFFSSKVLFVQKLLLRRIVVLFCVRDQKRKFVHVVSPPLRCSHASKISGTCCVFCAKIFRFLFLCIKLKLFSKEYSLIHAHAPYHKKETSSGDAPPFDLLKPFRVLIDTGE